MKTKCLVVAQFNFTSKKGRPIKSGRGILDFGKYGNIEITSEKLFGLPLFQEIDVTIDVDEYGKIIITKVG